MKVHTNDLKNSLKGVKEIKSILSYVENKQEISLQDEDMRVVVSSFNTSILKSAMKQLVFETDKDIALNTVVNYKVGVKVNDEFEFLQFGNYVVYKVEKNEEANTYQITCYDKMLYSMKSYDEFFTKDEITYPITIRNYINLIATKMGLTFKDIETEFSNYNKEITRELYYNQGYNLRDVLDELASATASIICVNQNDELEVRYITETNDVIDEDFLRDINVTFGKKYGPVNSVVLSRNGVDNVYLQDEESIATNGLCEIKITDNQIMNWNDRSDYLQDILTRLDGLEYYLNDFQNVGIMYYDIADRYSIKIGDNTYSCVMFNDELEITQGTNETIYTEIPSSSETDYSKADKTDRKINQTYLIVDKQNQEITALVSKTDNLETKTTQLRLDVDKIEGQISDIADITTTVEGTGTLVAENVNESEPIYIKIYPRLGDIKSLYPADDLYPSDTLYPNGKTLHFHCTSEVYDIDYELPRDLLWFSNDIYDEFILDYDNNACYVIQRVGVDNDGNKYALASSIQINYEYSTINLISGDYEISLIRHPNAYIYVRLMVQNIYTDQFATKVEMNSKITQTANEINLEVAKKVGNNEVISRINQSPETVTIQANKVNIGGVIIAINNNTTTTINGDKITTGSITANQIKSNTITADKVSSDVITTNNFSAQNINANKITSGTLSTDRLESKVITTDNFSAQNINADKITTGTLSTSRLNTDVITTSNFSAQSISANQITSGSLSADRVSGGTLTGSNIDVYSGTGFLRYMTSQSIHPFISALNMAYGTGNGVSFRSSTTRGSLGSALGHLSVGDAQLLLEAYSGSGRNMYVAGPSISIVTNTGVRNSTSDYEGSIYMYASANVNLNARNGHVFAGSGTSGQNTRVAVDSSGPSSRNLKENITDFEDYDSALRLLKNMKIDNYNDKYKLSDKKEQYGFIIDDLLDDEDAQKFLYFKDDKAIPNEQGYFDYLKAEEEPENKNIINFKRYDEEMLVKYLLITNKALLKKIEELEEKINGKN